MAGRREEKETGRPESAATGPGLGFKNETAQVNSVKFRSAVPVEV